MRGAGRALAVVAIGIAAFLGVFCSIHLFDEPLSPEVERVLAVRSAADPRGAEGFRRLLAFQADEGLELDTVGRKLYQARLQRRDGTRGTSDGEPRGRSLSFVGDPALCREIHCPADKIEALAPLLRELRRDNRILIERFDLLLESGLFARDLPPSPSDAEAVAALVPLTRFQLSELSDYIHSGRSDQAAASLRRTWDFLTRSLAWGGTRAEAAILVSLLKQLRDFARAAGREDPIFDRALNRAPWSRVPDLDALGDRLRDEELRAFERALRDPVGPGRADSLFGWPRPPRNRTLNFYHRRLGEILRDATGSPGESVWARLVNPWGRRMAEAALPPSAEIIRLRTDLNDLASRPVR